MVSNRDELQSWKASCAGQLEKTENTWIRGSEEESQVEKAVHVKQEHSNQGRFQVPTSAHTTCLNPRMGDQYSECAYIPASPHKFKLHD